MAKKKQSQKRLKKNIRLESLDPKYAPKVRKELLDYDPEFLRKLKKENPEDYKYLAQFIDEYVGGSVSKKSNGTVKPGHLHSTKELAKDVYKKNNDRNNDVLGVSRANNLASDVITELQKNDGWYITNAGLTEEAIISQFEEKESEESILSRKEFKKLKKKIDAGEAYMTPEMLLFYLDLYDEDLE